MNILFDFIPFQHAGGIGGHASFTKRILDEILLRKEDGIRLFGAVDSTMPRSEMYDTDQIAATNNISLIDLSKNRLSTAIEEHHIEVFFIAIGQLYAKYDLKGIRCKTVMFIHDIFDVERCDNWVDAIIFDQHIDTLWTQAKRWANLLGGRWNRQKKACYDTIIPLYSSPNTKAYTVSHYTKSALRYYFNNVGNDIKICYSPIKNPILNPAIENTELANLIDSGCPYLLMLAANRRYKNPRIITQVFQRLKADRPEIHLLTLKYGSSICAGHVDIEFLSDSDLEHAYKNAAALVFPSFFEGFGYPPIEAAKYSTPTVASNVTSIPEILGDAGCYFSPFYPAALYQAILTVLDGREQFAERARKRYEYIKEIQERQLKDLIRELTTI